MTEQDELEISLIPSNSEKYERKSGFSRIRTGALRLEAKSPSGCRRGLGPILNESPGF